MTRKIIYTGAIPLHKALKDIAENSPEPCFKAMEEVILYTLNKAGLIEDGIHPLQLEAATDAFIEAMELVDKHLSEHFAEG